MSQHEKQVIATAGIVPFTPDNKILLQERLVSKNGEEWAFFGGHLERDETPEECVRREAMEELCWDITGHHEIAVTMKDQRVRIVEEHTFMVPVPELASLTLREGKAMRLFTVEEAKGLKMHPGDDEILGKISSFLKEQQ